MFTDPNALTDPAVNRYLELLITGIISAGVAGFFGWFFGRKKIGSEINVNESEVIQKLVNTIGDLQDDLDSYIERAKLLRVEVETIGAAKRDADRLIDQVKLENDAQVRDVHKTYVAEKRKLAESVVKMLMIITEIQSEIETCPNHSDLKREGVRLKELLHYVHGQLTTERKNPVC
jgi:hypothetical protein